MNNASPLDDALALLVTLAPVQRARVLAALLDGNNLRLFTAMRAEAVYEATRTAPNAAVAAELGVSVKAVEKAVTAHRRATAHPSPIDTSE